MFSIVIPTLNNFNYLKICLESLKKNSTFNNEILVHVNQANDEKDKTIEYLKKNKIRHTFSEKNFGMCTSVNLLSKLTIYDHILYSHDDMYFLPNWDLALKNELSKLSSNFFFLSGTLIGPGEYINFNCGDTYEDFNEKKLLENYKNLNFHDFQGTHFAPHLIHKELWNKVAGFSEEFNPGFGSDPDLNLKLWNEGVRYFKGCNNFKVYHFGSISLRKKSDLTANKGSLTFLKKWGITISFFKKNYLKSGERFVQKLSEPNKCLLFYLGLIKCKLKLVLLILKEKISFKKINLYN